jgi:hypothetical protein
MAAGKSDYLRLVWSASLAQGLLPGFGFIFRPDTVVGAKRFRAGTLIFRLDSSSLLVRKDTAGSQAMLEELRRLANEAGVDVDSYLKSQEAKVQLQIHSATGAFGKNRQELAEVLHALEGRKRFELAPHNVTAIEITRPGAFRSGKIAIRTSQGEHRIRILAAQEVGTLLTEIVPMFEGFVPGKVFLTGRPRQS